MRKRLRKAWESRAPRDRRAIVLLTVILGASLYLWLITSAGQARDQLRSSVPVLRLQVGNFEQQASEYERLKIAPPIPQPPGDLHALLQTQVEAAGISHALVRVDLLATDEIQVMFSAVPFADWLDWVAAVQLQQVRLGSGRIEALPEPGKVIFTGVFVRVRGE
ncbi:MAG: type II secretion system protein M [Nitrosospira sp.]|nr:type II secretion system protein M [Nitrosospira sp.]